MHSSELLRVLCIQTVEPSYQTGLTVRQQEVAQSLHLPCRKPPDIVHTREVDEQYHGQQNCLGLTGSCSETKKWN